MRVYARRPLADRFWAKVDKCGPDECWLWTGAKNPDGYGHVSVARNVSRRAHRVVFDLTHPDAPLQADEQACHSCDTPLCVNPAHLWRGTRKENMQDAARKGRVFARMRGVTHCKRGHEFTPENTRVKFRDSRSGRTTRGCRTCERFRSEEQARQRARLGVSRAALRVARAALRRAREADAEAAG